MVNKPSQFIETTSDAGLFCKMSYKLKEHTSGPSTEFFFADSNEHTLDEQNWS
jgi:hypothetical protein